MPELYRLPLFPLKAVLFPGMVLPLHIFEARYIEMIEYCSKENKPFGVALIREGEEVGKNAIPYDVGTSAYITEKEDLQSGNFNIWAVGYQRFKIHQLHHNKPYLEGTVENAPIGDTGQAENQTLARKNQPLFREYFDILSQASESTLSLPTLPEDSNALAFLIAIMLPLSIIEKQALLESENLADLLKAEHPLLKREIERLRYRIENPPQRLDPKTPFSNN